MRWEVKWSKRNVIDEQAGPRTVHSVSQKSAKPKNTTKLVASCNLYKMISLTFFFFLIKKL